MIVSSDVFFQSLGFIFFNLFFKLLGFIYLCRKYINIFIKQEILIGYRYADL